jgi:hypothetical protein
MKNVWKWAVLILGILIVLVLVASPFLLRFGLARTAMNVFPHGWMGMGGSPGPRMMHGFSFFGGMGMMLFRLIGNLVVLGLIVAGVVALVKVFSTPRMAAQPIIPAASPAPVSAPVQTLACKACGKALQPDWMHCPFCGETV